MCLRQRFPVMRDDQGLRAELAAGVMPRWRGSRWKLCFQDEAAADPFWGDRLHALDQPTQVGGLHHVDRNASRHVSQVRVRPGKSPWCLLAIETVVVSGLFETSHGLDRGRLYSCDHRDHRETQNRPYRGHVQIRLEMKIQKKREQVRPSR